MQTVIDGYSRVADAKIHGNEKGVTAAGVLERAVAFCAGLGHSDENPPYRQICG